MAVSEAYDCPAGGMMGGFYGNYGNTAMIISWLVFILCIALIIAAIYWFITSANKKNNK